MGWGQKDAVGEPIEEGDRVKVFRNFGRDDECTVIVGHCGVAAQIEKSTYVGRLAVRVKTDSGVLLWVHHKSVMKV